MKIKLLKAARIKHKPGDIVDVTPEEYMFLCSIEAAIPVKEKEAPKKGTKKK